jgi:hypothetical protein
MMSMVGAEIAPDTTAALVLAHTRGDRRRRLFDARRRSSFNDAGRGLIPGHSGPVMAQHI